MKLSPDVKMMLAITTLMAVPFPIIMTGLLIMFRDDPLFGPNYSGPIHMRVGNFYDLFTLLLFMGLAIQLFVALHYLVYASDNQIAADGVRKLLMVGFFILPVVAMPVYYWFYIWPGRAPGWALKPNGGPAVP